MALGLAALRRGLTGATGLVSTLPPFASLRLVDPGDIVLGGHEVRGESLEDSILNLHRGAGVFDRDMIEACRADLRGFQRNIRPGTLYGSSSTIRRLADRGDLGSETRPTAIVERLAGDIEDFRRRHRLGSVVVIDVASTEPPLPDSRAHRSWAELEQALSRRGSRVVRASSLYALAALKADCPFVNFTPSTGIRLPGLRQHADRLGLPYMGADGKTGETLVKSALAPMFAGRHLEVESWFGQNILGNRDGAVLRDSGTLSSKTRSKDRTVRAIVGGRPATHVGIDYVASLNDWKVAWDFIHFRGFLDTRMHMQFVWHGCDSALAAPLVIDLARLMEWELRQGNGGAMRHLAYFFKDPLDVDVLDLPTQWRMLVDRYRPGPRNIAE